jgi:hypothetical protein
MISRGFFRIVNGEIKRVPKQEKRCQGNPLGLNHKDVRTINEFPEWLAAPAVEVPCESERNEKIRKRKLARSFLGESTKSEKSLTLVKEVLLKGKDPQEMSWSLNINYATARSLVARGKNSLGLPGRKETQKKRGQQRSR